MTITKYKGEISIF